MEIARARDGSPVGGGGVGCLPHNPIPLESAFVIDFFEMMEPLSVSVIELPQSGVV
ncbi:uncharacterized protein PHACADRAFT_266204 [Phanerochaete carnosa HHB-10118-sp]|uniref:Uncharacterized protein n=1 Tax=Phanerochaete carnosa (strain HHB-10118-sp) TaxID=650164 RepID=K5VQ20_PHACS|nr:uncharacterized protein PHACADRAFT_266204 [Phanerochaete carnosa HHB-10118-sp]EKM48694.1 hypothetical protein PHACADRAFT_266204 [Phanerochaete carnosa HHB-10118-sp]